MADSYHHGNLREAALERAAVIIAAEGPHLFSLRSLAADLGVSHTAPRHHFGSKEGVLSALATQGFDRLTERMRVVGETGGNFLDLGVTYVEFALDCPAHFQVMFTPSLLDESDPELDRARRALFAVLTSGVDQLAREGRTDDAAAAVTAGWSIVHGFATLALTGNLDNAGIRELFADTDLLSMARRSTSLLYGPPAPQNRSETPDE